MPHYGSENHLTSIHFGTDVQESYSFSASPYHDGRLRELTLHRGDAKPELIGSAVLMNPPFLLGQSAILGVETDENDRYVLVTPPIAKFGVAPS